MPDRVIGLSGKGLVTALDTSALTASPLRDSDARRASVVYLPYTPTTSSTMLRRTLVQEVASRSPQGAQ